MPNTAGRKTRGPAHHGPCRRGMSKQLRWRSIRTRRQPIVPCQRSEQNTPSLPNFARATSSMHVASCCTPCIAVFGSTFGCEKRKNIAHWIDPDWLRVLHVESPLGPSQDLRIGEVEIAQAREQKVEQCQWAVRERHRAIVWLVGEEGPSTPRLRPTHRNGRGWRGLRYTPCGLLKPHVQTGRVSGAVLFRRPQALAGRRPSRSSSPGQRPGEQAHRCVLRRPNGPAVRRMNRWPVGPMHPQNGSPFPRALPWAERTGAPSGRLRRRQPVVSCGPCGVRPSRREDSYGRATRATAPALN